MGSSGRRTQPVMPASAMDAPITFRKPRRETESTHSEAPLGNSRCSASWKAGLPASSSRLRQSAGPAFSLASLIWERRESRSSLPFFEGQTSSRLSILFCSSILSPLRGLFLILLVTHGLRRGLQSFAASRLLSSGFGWRSASSAANLHPLPSAVSAAEVPQRLKPLVDSISIAGLKARATQNPLHR